MADLNAKVGAENRNVEHVMGKWRIGARNENGDMLIEACSFAGLVIGGSLFPHKHCNQATWISSDNLTENLINHFCISNMWRSSLLDVRVKRSADIASDHHQLVATMRLKTAAIHTPQDKVGKKLDVSKLQADYIKNGFVVEFNSELSSNQSSSIEQKWSSIKNAFLTVCENVLGFRGAKKKMSEITWALIEQRRSAK